MFVDKTYVSRFYSSDQIWLFIFGHFLKFSLVCDINFWQISSPPLIYVSKDALNHFLVNSSTKNSLKRAKNVVFFLFCILVDRPMQGVIAPPALPLATLLRVWEFFCFLWGLFRLTQINKKKKKGYYTTTTPDTTEKVIWRFAELVLTLSKVFTLFCSWKYLGPMYSMNKTV